MSKKIKVKMNKHEGKEISPFTGKPTGQRTKWRLQENYRWTLVSSEKYRKNYDEIDWKK